MVDLGQGGRGCVTLEEISEQLQAVLAKYGPDVRVCVKILDHPSGDVVIWPARMHVYQWSEEHTLFGAPTRITEDKAVIYFESER